MRMSFELTVGLPSAAASSVLAVRAESFVPVRKNPPQSDRGDHPVLPKSLFIRADCSLDVSVSIKRSAAASIAGIALLGVDPDVIVRAENEP